MTTTQELQEIIPKAVPEWSGGVPLILSRGETASQTPFRDGSAIRVHLPHDEGARSVQWAIQMACIGYGMELSKHRRSLHVPMTTAVIAGALMGRLVAPGYAVQFYQDIPGGYDASMNRFLTGGKILSLVAFPADLPDERALFLYRPTLADKAKTSELYFSREKRDERAQTFAERLSRWSEPPELRTVLTSLREKSEYFRS